MQRYPIFDPPEYLHWKPEPEVMEEYRQTIRRDPARLKLIRALTRDELLAMYAGMIRFRLHDITLHRWVRQGIISKAWLGTGEEATTVGAVHALDRQTDKVAPMIRNAGACHEMGMPVVDMLRGYLATEDSPTKGRDLHIGDLHRGIIAPVSPVGGLCPVVAGIALSFKQNHKGSVVLTWVGDGSTKTSAFHEGVNLAAVLRMSAIYILQNNQVALGTRLSQHQVGPFTSWSKAYGVTGLSCDGNNVLDTWAATRQAAAQCRNGGGPVMIFAETFRMGGHATHDEKEGRAILPAELYAHWGRRDPVATYEVWLREEGLAESVLEETERRIVQELELAAKDALSSLSARMPKPEDALKGVYAD
jgi:TPP-dependent pyruvate/acetoin dehydrogenase alpha subunit